MTEEKKRNDHPDSTTSMASNTREAVTPLRELLTSWLARLYQHRLTTTTGGNLSLLDDDGILYITPSGGDKAIVPPQHIAIRRPGHTDFEGSQEPSMEWPLHTAAYDTRRSVRAVLHAHSKTLMAFSLARYHKNCNKKTSLEEGDDDNDDDPRVPNTRYMLQTWHACGKVAVAPYEMPGSEALAQACRRAFATGADCVILENHGVVVVGSSLHNAYDRFVSLEYLAMSMVHAQPLMSLNHHHTSSIAPPPTETTLKALVASMSVGDTIPTIHTDRRLMTGQEKKYRAELCKFVHRAYEQNLVASSTGSFSIRLPTTTRTTDNASVDDQDKEPNEGFSFLITPSEVDRKMLQEAHVCFLTTRNSKLMTNDNCDNEEKRDYSPHQVGDDSLVHCPVHHPSSPEHVSPSRAARIHATILERHTDIHCILVTQPPFATAYCLTGCRMDSGLVAESHVVLQHVTRLTLEQALKDHGRGFAEALDPAQGKTTVLVQNYGVVTVGPTLLKTFVQLEVLESMSGVTLQAMMRGMPMEPLSKKQKLDLSEAFLSKRAIHHH